jgi:hypothetical protein
MRCDAIQFIIHGSADLLHRRPFFPLFVVLVVVRVVAVAVHPRLELRLLHFYPMLAVEVVFVLLLVLVERK